MRAVLLSFALLVAPIQTAQAKSNEAAHFSGTELYAMCASKYDTDYGYCAGYVSAIANTMLTESVSGYRACNLTQARSQEFVDVYTSYADIFRDKLDGEARDTVAAALARAFPCVN